MEDNPASAPVRAWRLGPGQFLLDMDRLESGVAFKVEGRTFTIVAKPVALAMNNYLATVRETDGPATGRQLTVQLLLGPLRH